MIILFKTVIAKIQKNIQQTKAKLTAQIPKCKN